MRSNRQRSSRSCTLIHSNRKPYEKSLNAAERDVSELIVRTAIDQDPIDVIFNFAVSLKDSICRNRTSETFEESFKEKMRAAKCLGEKTRKFCQNFYS
uniref:Uncharacterized protein n=1 Tax=Vespula pensylvanica TaxID=30213 RepID=A0A834P7A2_VESPE|nr:hypothetical protein H0235_004459 [Vespula pensylvanica]